MDYLAGNVQLVIAIFVFNILSSLINTIKILTLIYHNYYISSYNKRGIVSKIQYLFYL